MSSFSSQINWSNETSDHRVVVDFFTLDIYLQQTSSSKKWVCFTKTPASPEFRNWNKKIPLLKCERIWLQPSYRSNKTPENSISLKMTPKNTQCTPDGGFFSTQLSNRKGIPNNWYWHAWLVEVQESFFSMAYEPMSTNQNFTCPTVYGRNPANHLRCIKPWR